jgi:hypothetical protein
MGEENYDGVSGCASIHLHKVRAYALHLREFHGEIWAVRLVLLCSLIASTMYVDDKCSVRSFNGVLLLVLF